MFRFDESNDDRYAAIALDGFDRWQSMRGVAFFSIQFARDRTEGFTSRPSVIVVIRGGGRNNRKFKFV